MEFNIRNIFICFNVIFTPLDYDPNISDKIICVELENNQQIFVEYEQGWTVKDLISAIISRKDYQILQQKRNLIFFSIDYPDIFDLSLCFYDTIVPEHENRVADYISIEKLHEMHIKSNLMTDSYIYSNNYKLDQLKEIKDSKYNHYAIYLDYMPKIIKWNLNIFLAHPELEDYFVRNKRGYNEFNTFKRNILTCNKKLLICLYMIKKVLNF